MASQNLSLSYGWSLIIYEKKQKKNEEFICHKQCFSSPYCETFVHSVQWTSSDWLLASLPLGGAAINTPS